MAPKEKAEAQTFTFHEVACMIAAMNAGGVTLGQKHYSLMAKLDGERTASGFEHKFRAVKARGKDLATELNDEASTPKTTKSAKKTTTSTGKKRGSESYLIRILLDLTNNIRLAEKDIENFDDDAVPQTPSKKTKVKKEPSVEPSAEISDHGSDGYGMNGSHYDNAIGTQ